MHSVPVTHHLRVPIGRALVAVILAAGISSCGGGAGGDDKVAGTGGAAPLSKPKYIAQANASCATALAEALAVKAPLEKSGPNAVRYLDRVLSIFDDMIRDLKALAPPPADKATISSLIGSADTSLEQGQRARDALARNDLQGYAAADEASNAAGDEASRIAGDYGIAACDTRSTTDKTTSTTPSGPSVGDGAKDVHITSCGATPGGIVQVKGTIVNSLSQPASYDVYVNFLDASGTQVANGIDIVSNVAPGATALWDTIGVEDYAPGMVCKIAKVNRST